MHARLQPERGAADLHSSAHGRPEEPAGVPRPGEYACARASHNEFLPGALLAALPELKAITCERTRRCGSRAPLLGGRPP